LIRAEDIDLNDDGIQNGLELLEDYAEDMMHWSASLIYTSSRPGQPVFNLFNPEFYAIPRDENDPSSQIELETYLRPSQRKGFSDLLKGQKSKPLHRVYEELTYADINEGHSGLSSFCGTLYDACTP
jgi:hypothetical protein